MSSVTVFLVAVGVIILIGAVGELVAQKTGIPDVLWLIAVGVALGPVTSAVTRADLAAVAPYFAALTLVVVLFEGGSRLQLAELSRAAPRSGLLAALTFAASLAVIAPVSFLARSLGILPETWSMRHGLLLGAVLGGPSAIVVMPALLRSGVGARVSSHINLECAFTDAFSVVAASALMELLSHGPGGAPGLWLARSCGVALLIGATAGAAWLPILRVLRKTEQAYPVTLAALLLLYVAIGQAGGTAALGILTFAVIVGNAAPISSALRLESPVDLGDVRGVHTQIAFIIKAFFFTFIGAMLGPPWPLTALGAVLGALLLAARIPASRLALLGAGVGTKAQRIVDFALARGMASGALATMPFAAGVAGTEQLPTLVFAAVLTSIVLFAAALPIIGRSPPEAEVPPIPVIPNPAESAQNSGP